MLFILILLIQLKISLLRALILGLQCSPEIPSNLIISEDTLGPYLEYPINSSCNSNLTANKLRIHLLCNKLQDVDGHVEATGINDCIYNVNLNTNLTCVEVKTNYLCKNYN